VHARTVHSTAEQAQFLLSPPLLGSCSSPVASVRAGSARHYRSFDELQLARSCVSGCNRTDRPGRPKAPQTCASQSNKKNEAPAAA